MGEIQDKKNEILNSFFKSKDGLSWNEATELLNELIGLASKNGHSAEDINIEMYKESLENYCELVCEAKEGRYDLTGYDLHVIEAALTQYLDSSVGKAYKHYGLISEIVSELDKEIWLGESIKTKLASDIRNLLSKHEPLKIQIEIDEKEGFITRIENYNYMTENGLTKFPSIAFVEFEKPTCHLKIYTLDEIVKTCGSDALNAL